MKTSTRKAAASKKKAKATRRPSPKAAHKKPPHSVRAPKMKKATAVHAKPRSIAGPARSSVPGKPRSGDSDRGLYVRFGPRPQGIEVKKNVQAFVDKLGISMNEYIVAATLKAIEEKWQPEMKPMAVESEDRKTA